MPSENGPGQDEPEASVRTTSDKKVRANRENARNSTGPRTEEGKRRSSRNAEKHGALSMIVEPISKGPCQHDGEMISGWTTKPLRGPGLNSRSGSPCILRSPGSG
jgi:hypothetical protein